MMFDDLCPHGAAMPMVQPSPTPIPRPMANIATGVIAVKIEAAGLGGVWSLRFGAPGCPEPDMRGGMVAFEPDRLIGADAIFSYQGDWRLDGPKLTANIEIRRRGGDRDLPSIFGTVEAFYRVSCTAEAIGPDLFEGRAKRPGYPDARIVMRRCRRGHDAAATVHI